MRAREGRLADYSSEALASTSSALPMMSHIEVLFTFCRAGLGVIVAVPLSEVRPTLRRGATPSRYGTRHFECRTQQFARGQAFERAAVLAFQWLASRRAPPTPKRSR
jgi:hypothetical protein